MVGAGAIAQPAEVDTFVFSLTNRSLVYFDSVTNGTVSQFRYRLLSTEGPVTTPSDSQLSDVQFTSDGVGFGPADLLAGTYRLQVYASGTTTGAYSFTLTRAEQAPVVVVGASQTGVLSPANETHLYQFEAAAGDWIALTNVTSLSRVRYRIYDSFGNSLMYFGDFPGAASRQIAQLPLTGRYLVAVEGLNNTLGSPTYTFRLSLLSNTPPASMTGTPIVPGEILRPSLAPGATSNMVLTLAQDTRLAFDVLTNVSGVNWTLRREGLEVVPNSYTSDEYLYNRFVRSLPAGTYELKLRNLDSQTRDSAFRFVAVDEVTELPFGTVANVALDAGNEIKSVRFAVPANTRAVVAFTNEFYTSASVYVLGSGNTVLGQLNAGPYQQQVGPFPEPAVLTLVVQGNQSGGSPLNVGVGVVPVTVVTNAISLGSVVSGQIDLAGQEQRFTFNLAAPGLFHFDVLTNRGAGLVASLAGPVPSVGFGDTSLGAVDGPNAYYNSQLPPILALPAGSYTLRLTKSLVSTEGSFAFRITDLSAATALSNPGTNDYALNPPTAAKVFSLNIPAGHRLRVNGSSTNMASTPTLRVIDPDGVAVARGDYLQIDDLLITKGGLWRLVVDPDSGETSPDAMVTLGVDASPDVQVPLVLGSSFSGTLVPNGPALVYEATFSETKRVVLDLVQGDEPIQLEVSGANIGVVNIGLADADLSSGSGIPWARELPPGTYTFRFRVPYWAAAGTYPLSFRILDMDAAPALVPGALQEIALADNRQMIIRKFALNEGGRVVHEPLSGSSFGAFPEAGTSSGGGTFYGPSANWFISFGAQYMAESGENSPSGTYYYVLAGDSTNNGATATARFKVHAGPKSVGVVATGGVTNSLGLPGQTVSHPFSVNQRERVFLDALADDPAYAHTWELYRQTSDGLGYDSVLGRAVYLRETDAYSFEANKVGSWTLDPGQYEVRVRAVNTNFGQYSFRILKSSEAPALALNSSVVVPMDRGSATVLRSLDLAAGSVLEILQESSDVILSQPVYRLRDAKGELVFDSQTRSLGTPVLISRSGRYTLSIEGYFFDASGPGSVTVRASVRTPVLFSGADFSASISGVLTNAAEVHLYSFRTTNDARFVMDARWAAPGVRWEIFNGSVPLAGAPYLDSSDAATLPTDGRAVVSLAPGAYNLALFGSADGDDYEFRWLDLTNATQVTLGDSPTVTLDPLNSTTALAFDAAEGDEIEVSLDGMTGTVDGFHWKLVDPTGSVLARGNGTTLNATTGLSGTYHLLVEGGLFASGSAVDVDLTLDLIGNSGTGPSITEFGTDLYDTLTGWGDFRTYRLEVTHDTLLKLDVVDNSDGTAWSLRGTNSAGQTVDLVANQPISDQNGYSFHEPVFVPAGHYEFRIENVWGDNRGFGVRWVNFTNAIPVEIAESQYDQYVEGYTDGSGMSAVRRFRVQKGDFLRLEGYYYGGSQVSLVDGAGHVFYRTNNYYGNLTFGHYAEADADLFLVVQSDRYSGSQYYYFYTRLLRGVAVTPIVLGQTVFDSLTNFPPSHLYSFTVTTQSWVRMDSLTNQSYAIWEIFDAQTFARPDNFSSTYNFAYSDAGNFYGNTHLPPGDYLLSVRRDDGNTDPFDASFRLLSPDQAAPLPLGMWTELVLDPATSSKVFRFEADGGERLFFMPTNSYNGSDRPYFRLVDPHGRDLGDLYSYNSFSYRQLNERGSYYLIAEGYPYLTSVQPPFLFKAELESSSTQPLTLGATYTGSLASRTQAVEFAFSLATEKRIRVDSLTNSYAQWMLLSSTGALSSYSYSSDPYPRSFSDTDGSSETRTFILPPGDYRFLVQSYDPTVDYYWANGTNYSFRLLDVADATPVTIGTAVTFTNIPGIANKLFRVDVQPGDRLHFVWLSATGFVDYANNEDRMYWRLYRPDGNPQNSGNMRTSFGELQFSAAGSYLLSAEPYVYDSAPTSTVSFVVLRTPPPQMLPLAFDTPVYGSLSNASARVEYTFDVSSPTVAFFDSLTNRFDISWQLDRSGSYVAGRQFSSSDGSSFGAGMIVLQPGSHRLVVKADSQVAGGYGFALRTPALAEVLPLSVAVTRSLTPANSTRLFQFNASAGDVFQFDAVSSSGTTPYYRVFGPQGNSWGNTSGDFSVNPYYSGPHILTVEGSVGFTSASATATFGLYSTTYTDPVPILNNLNLPDLQVTALSVSPDPGATSGQALTVNWTLRNAGDSPATNSWVDRVIVRNVDRNQTIVDTTVAHDVGTLGELAPGADRARSFNLILPAGLPGAGNLDVTILSDSASQVLEGNILANAEANNSRSFAFFSLLPALPDLRVIDLVAVPATGWTPGVPVTLNWSVTNAGSAAASGDWRDAFTVSNSTRSALIVSGFTNYLAGNPGNGSIAPGESRARSATFTVPNYWDSSGVLVTRVVADSTNAVPEAFLGLDGETNNTASITNTSAPDLQVASVSVAGSPGFLAGSPVTFTWVVTNTGSGPALYYWYSRVTVVNQATAQTILNPIFYHELVLPVGGSFTNSYTTSLPDGVNGAGTMAVTIAADTFNYITELSPGINAETNNSATTSFESLLPVYPDLRVVSAVLSNSPSLFAGGPATVHWTITNAGPGAASGPWWDRVAVTNAAGTFLINSDYYLNQAIPAGGTLSRTASVNLPAGQQSVGTLALIVTADYYNNEFELLAGINAETNNSLVSTATSVGMLFTQHPVGLVTNAGSTVSLVGSVSGGLPPYTFQWLKDGSPILGETNASLLLTNIQVNQTANYSLVAQDQVTTLTSSNAVVVVLPDEAQLFITRFEPLGLVTTNVTRFVVEFNRPIQTATFTSSDIALVGPGGPVNQALISIADAVPADGRTFIVTVPELGAEGTYTATIGPNVTDLSGNPMSSLVQVVNEDFSSSPAGWTFNGSSAWNAGGFLRLTRSGFGEAGSSFFGTAQTPAPFVVEFDFNMNAGAGSGDSDGAGADGITFIVANQPNAGSGGGGIGYQGYPGTSFAVEFDNYHYNGGDPDGDHIGIDYNGGLTSIATKVSRRFIDTGVWHATIRYDGNRNLLAIVRSPSNEFSVVSAELPANAIPANYTFGFASGTASGSANHDIDNVVVRLLPAGETNGAYIASFTIDKGGPSVTNFAPVEIAGSVQAVQVTFNESILASSFTAADVVLTGDSAPAVSGVVALSTNRFQINFAAPLSPGGYSLAVGPAITDLAGNAMNQNGNGVFGETPGDVFSTSLTVAVPNLVASVSLVPSAALVGSSVDVVYAITNTGTGPVTNAWSVGFYLATDASGAGAANVLNVSANTNLLAGASIVRTQSVTLPAGVFGGRFIGVRADVFSQVAETSEADNVDYSDAPVSILAADLVADALSAPPTASLGTSITVDWTVRNAGNGAATASWTDRVYLSSTAGSIAGARLLDTDVPASPLAAGGTYGRSKSLLIPLDANSVTGAFFIVFSGDVFGNQFETNEANNVRSVPIDITSPPLPDLVPTLLATPSIASLNGSIEVVYAVTNQGGTAATLPWSVSVLTATDTNGSGESVRGTFALNTTLSAGAGLVRTQTVTLPTGIFGERFVGLRADTFNQVIESVETNNVVYAPIPVVIQGADLAVSQITAPPTAILGTTINVAFDVTNGGDASASATWQDRIYLSSASNSLAGARLLDTVASTPPVAAGAPYSRNRSVAIPLDGLSSPGAFFLVVSADDNNAQVETNELNNLLSVPITLTLPPIPDLAVHSVAAPLQVQAGQPFSITYAVTNLSSGPAVAPWSIQFLVADDATGSGESVLTTVVINQNLAAGGVLSGSQSVVLPISATGTRFLGMRVDSANNVVESDEANNRRYTTIGTAVQSADLETIALSAPATAEQGTSISVAWSVKNSGSGLAEAPWTDRILLVRDPVTLADAVVLDTVNAPQTLAAGASYPQTKSVLLPVGGSTATGAFHVVIIADSGSLQPESDETNNRRSLPITITVPALPDLAATNVVVPAFVTPGLGFEVVWAVTNVGGAPVTKAWNDRVYLSTDAAFGSDILLATVPRTSLLAPGAGLVHTQVVTMPLTFSSPTGHVFVVADALEEIVEETELNNTARSVSPLVIQGGLTLSLPLTQVREDAVNPAMKATVFRVGDISAPLVVSLASSNTAELTVPATVTIPAGASSAQFNVTVVPDGVPDGDKDVVLAVFATDVAGDFKQVRVVDVNVPSLALTLGAPSVGEGLTVPVTVSAQVARAADSVIALYSFDQGQLAVPPEVILPAGATSVVFAALAVDDTLIETNRAYQIRATSLGFNQAESLPLTIVDNDKPTLVFGVEPASFSEAGGSQAARATITRSPVTDQAIVLRLASSDPTAATVPLSVTIPANQPSVSFYVAAVDDLLVDGPQAATLSAFVTTTIGNTLLSGPASTSVTVTDNEGPALRLKLNRTIVAEGIASATFANVSRNTETSSNLTVSLVSSDTTEATLPASVVIPAGSTNVIVQIDSVEDNVSDETQTATLTASADGFAPGSDVLQVTDVDKADLSVTDFVTPVNGYTDETLTLSFKVLNQGKRKAAANTIQRVYLSKDATFSEDDALIGQVPFNGEIGAGQQISLGLTFYMPHTPGTYYFVAKADAGLIVDEVDEDNNVAVSSVVTVLPDYTATVSTPFELGLAGTSVPLNGSATKINGDPASFKPVNVHVVVRGSRRVITVLTDVAGRFSTVFNPLPNEAGNYTVGAAHPGEPVAPTQDQFTLLGLLASPQFFQKSFNALSTFTGEVELENLADVDLTSVSATISSVSGITASVDITNRITGLTKAPVRLQITSTTDEDMLANLNIRVVSAEGVVLDIPVYLQVKQLRPSLLVSPGTVRVGVVRGSVRTVELEVVNTGAANSGAIDILLPSVFPWMSIASANPIPNLAPGETNIISLQLSPQADFPIGEYKGNFAVQGTNNLFVSIPFTIKNVSSAVGDLKITTVDENTYYGSNQVNLAGARVVVRDPFNGEAVAQGNTGPDGTFQMAGIREGIYNLEVSAPKHDTVTGTVEIKPGELTDRVVFLRTQLVTYRWTVEEIEIEDRVKITIESVFETFVPTPVVTVEPSVIDVSTILGNEGQINIKISNKGLIAANNTELTVPEHPDWEFIPLIKTVGVLPAKSSLTIPMTVRKKGGSGAAPLGLGLSKKKTMSGGPCSLSAGVKWDIVCGPFNIGYNVPMLYVNLSSGCFGLGGGGGGWGGWGGWGGGGFGGGGVGGYTGTPFYSPPEKCACDSGNFNPKCIEGEAGIQIDVKGKLLDLANKMVSAIPAALSPSLRGFAVKGFAKGQLCDCCENNIKGVKAKGEAGASAEVVIGLGKSVEIGAAAVSIEGVADVSGSLKGFAGLEITGEIKGTGSLETECFLRNPKLCVTGSGALKGFVGIKLNAEITGTIEGEGVHAEGEAAFGLETSVSGQAQACTGQSPTARACFDGLVLKGEGTVAFVKPNGSKVYRKIGATYEIAGPKCSDDPAPSTIAAGPVDPSSLLARFGFTTQDQAVRTLAARGPQPIQVAPSQSSYLPLLPASVTSPTSSGSARKVEFVSLPPRPASEKRATPSGITTKDAGGVCAQVRLQIEQTASLTRKAIGATLEVDNQSDTSTVDDLTVQINIYGPDGSLANDKFVILKPETSNLTVLNDGTFDANGFGRPLWQIAPGQTGRSRWVIIPLDAAAPEVPVLYTVGGVMTYSVGGAPTSVVLAPGPVTVYPNPKLALKYFHQRDVYSDDPFTDEIEPSVPYILAVMTKNNGKGLAKKFSITSSQPKIIENYKGLLIDFKIIATDVDNMPLTPTLTANFGDMNPGDVKIGRWYLTSTLQGLFVDYSAKFEHEDSLGGRATSPIESVEIHELIHPVFALGARSDGRQDFLVNDVPDDRDLPDTVHLSDFTTNSVSVIELATFDGAPSAVDLEIQMTVVPTNGFFYVRVPDPADKSLYLVGAVRGDGRSLPVNTNVWRTDRTFVGLGKPPVKENILHLFDDGGSGSYTLFYSLVPPATDTVAPTSHVAVLPASSLPQIPVVWSGTDNVPGSGVAYYDVFVSEDGGPFLPWLRNTPRTSAIYEGQFGHGYAFYSVATDNAANREAAPGAPDAETYVGRVNNAPTLTVSPTVTVDEGSTALFGNTASDIDPGDVLTFSLGAGSPAGASIDPVTGNVTWPTSDVLGDQSFNVVVIVADNGIPSLGATGVVQVIVRDLSVPPTVAGQPQSRTNAAGSTATFNVSVNSLTTPNFQWRRNGIELPGQDQAVLVLPGVQRSVDAGLYDVVVRNPGGSVTSTVARLVVNTLPVATDDTLTRQTNKTVRVRLSTLLANDSDPDADALSVASISPTSAKGASVSLDGGWVLYRADAGMNEPDTFSYTVTDAFGATATATVHVDLGNTSGPTSNLISVTPLPDGRRIVRGLGIPGRTLRIQATGSLSEPVTWTEIGSVVIDPTGLFEFTDLDAPAFGTRFYRATE